jgi:hypothetical protein
MENADNPKNKENTVEVEVNNLPESDTVVVAVEKAVEDVVVEVPAVAVEEKVKFRVVEVPQQIVRSVIGSGDTDTVYLSKCVFKNKYARKSLTVHHVQRRLTELGYTNAVSDKDGWYGDLTAMDVAAYQAARNIEGDGTMNAGTFAALFDGDRNVTVSLD